MKDDFVIENKQQWTKEGIEKIVRMGERLLEEKGRAGDILRSIPKIIIGGLKEYKIFENK